MRAEVDESGGPVGTNDLERKRMAGFGQAFPGQADLTGQFIGGHFRRYAGNQARNFQLIRGLHQRVECD